ncbi:ELMO domain-containing protein 3-like [Watersipora subatra]|uniref:ELMO domain-containing protein 3-like n=1 Tax=Watersipora subatra TaxID=2589382 RepID=UPI00355BFE23
MDKEFLAAEEEWNAVPSVIISKQDPTQRYQHGESVETVDALTSTSGAIEYFRRHVNLPYYQQNIKTSIKQSRLRSCFNLLFGPPGLHPSLADDRDLLFSMALWQLDDSDLIQVQMLYTVYRQITHAQQNPPRYGAHWDDIGFQGTDPATDLRGAGCLGLVNMVYFTTTQKYRSIFLCIFSMSQHSLQNFPFCVMSLNMTRIALHALRSQFLNKPANHSGDIIAVFNDFYVGCFFAFATIWKQGHKTIEDSGVVIKDVEAYCCKNVTAVLRKLALCTDEQAIPTPTNSEPVDEFTNLERL